MASNETSVRTDRMSEPPVSPIPGMATRYGWCTENDVEASPTFANTNRKQHPVMTLS